jgi:hypothetical protein
MIIKITRSTSRISIKGTTFISETIPRLPPTDIPIIHLAPVKCPARRTLTSTKAAANQATSENGWGKPHPYKTKKPRGTLIR